MRAAYKPILFAYLFIISFFTSPVQAADGIVRIIDAEKTYEVGENLTLWKADNSTTLADIINETFVGPLITDAVTDEFESNQHYWGKFQLINELEGGLTDWVLNFSLMNTAVEVFVLTKNQENQTYQTGAFLPPSQRSFLPKIKANVVSIDVPAKDTVSVYFRAISERTMNPPEFDLQLREKDAYFKELIREKAWNYFYIGIVFLLMLSNLILLRFVKLNAYCFYAVYLFGIIIFSMYNSGDLADLLYPYIFPNYPMYIYFFKLSIYFSLICYIGFISSFLDLPTLMPKWDKYLKRLCIFAIPCIVIEILLLRHWNYSFKGSDWFNIGYAAVFVLAMVGFLEKLYPHLKYKKIKYIFCGTICMCFGITMTGLLRVKGVDFSFKIFQASSLLEFLFFSLGLAYARKQNEAAKQEAMQQKELIAFKDNFYSGLMHEFITPLTLIKGLARKKERNPEDNKRIFNNAEQLHSLINELLQLSKLDTNQLSVNYQEVEIVAEIYKWIDSLSILAEEKNQSIKFEPIPKAIFMETDTTHLMKIFGNLLTNAIKYTPRFGTIEIGATQKADQVHIYVKDNGRGIPLTQLKHIFERFYRIPLGNKKIEGEGIGLSLVKELTELMGGKISASSQINIGSIFKLELPIHPKEGKITAKPTPTLTDEKIPAPITLFNESLNGVREAEDENENEEKPILLVIEDNEDLVYLYNGLLKGKYQVEIALNGKKGLSMAMDLIPDVIICDLMMPEMDGFEVCEALKKDDTTNHIPIIMVTAKYGVKEQLNGYRIGVDVFLEKPFNNDVLYLHIDKLYKRSKEMQELYSKISLMDIADDEEKAKNILRQKEDFFGIEDEFLQKVNTILQSNLTDDNYSVSKLSKEILLGEKQLGRKIKIITGYTTVKYIRFYRIIQAKKILLSDKSIALADVSEQVGFSAQGIFSKAFREFYNETPTDMRKRLLGD